MADQTEVLDREGWLTEAAHFILDDVIMPLSPNFDKPPIRLSVGFPTGRTRKSTITACYQRELSADHTNEIFVSPEVDDSLEILVALTHELIHAVDDCASGHTGHFRHVALQAGLLPPLPLPRAQQRLIPQLEEIITLLGNIPHAKLDLKAGVPADSARQLKCKCNTCGFIFRTSQKWITIIRSGDSGGGLQPCMACGAVDIWLDV